MTTMQTIPVDLMVSLRDRYGLQQFVETGTFHGDTAIRALAYFDTVTTCEISPEQVAILRRRLPSDLPPPKKLRLVCGNSPDVLRDVFAGPECLPALVWLDAHFCGVGMKLGPECPLIDELRSVGGTHGRYVILCDDARLFLNPPPPPHDPSQWPTFAQIVELCRELGPTDTVEIIGDVIVIRPC